MIGASVAIYEKNGDYVLGIFSSGWCRLLDQASRNLCNTDDNKEALKSGRWHCHESCWEAAKQAMETGRPVDSNCQGGIHLFAVPILAGGEIAGSISLGYGNPPRSRERLRKIAEKYGLEADCLALQVSSSSNWSPLLIDLVKRYLGISAGLIGEIVKCRLTEEALRKADHALAERTVHDLNNILASMMGYAEQIIDGLSEKNPALSHLHAMLKAIQQARELLRQALDCNVQKGQEQEPMKPKGGWSAPFLRGEESILLVDDEEAVIFVGQKILSHLGYKVFSRTSSLEALEAFRAQPQQFDLVIVDQSMPNMTGTELARELIAIRPDIPIILCTGFHKDASRQRIRDFGIRDLIIKPIDMQEVARTIRTVLSERG